ncbi:chitin-binding domain-containing protein [Actibacterium sp. 188UL27-1]|uniref:chitin-binding domain-containing protein n=1 Tax=Actibacterium sp. 188UL27-1 TaxID=2786961 RepID=UPI001959B777|nr:chitin-binding domain-containing protein [Actibacterium sp. 188UL27-1]MBM7069583.1 adenylosuccinate lyase [Actibacterium sp. 188UL27-1]
MKIKTTLAALLLAAVPTMSLAYNCNYGKAETATITCSAGMVFDANSGKCVDQVNS